MAMSVLKWLLPVAGIGFVAGVMASSDLRRFVAPPESQDSIGSANADADLASQGTLPEFADSGMTSDQFADHGGAIGPNFDDRGTRGLPDWLFTPETGDGPGYYDDAQPGADGPDYSALEREYPHPVDGNAEPARTVPLPNIGAANDAAARAAAAARDVRAAESGS